MEATQAEAVANLRTAMQRTIDLLVMFGIDVKGWSKEQKDAHWKAFDRISRSWEGKYIEGARKGLEQDKREILAMLTGAKKKALERKATINWEELEDDVEGYLSKAGAENWRKTFAPLIRGMVSAQGKRWAAELGLAFDVENLFSRKWFNDYLLKFAQPINETTRDDIARILARAQADGASIPDVQKQFIGLFDRYLDGVLPEDPEFQWFTDRVPAYRTELIARTELTRSAGAGTDALFKEWNVQKKEWLATRGDGRTRDTHAEADGQVVNMDEPFIVGGFQAMFPGDPALPMEESANCRCTELPAGLDE
jgi:uncharacterized protein with gpF-like domain